MYVTWVKEDWEEKKGVTMISWEVLLWKTVCVKEHWEGKSLAITEKHPKAEFWETGSLRNFPSTIRPYNYNQNAKSSMDIYESELNMT